MPRRPARKNATTKNAAQTHANVSQDEIAREAFKMFQARHGAPGDPVADWFEAEKIVRSRLTATPRKAQPKEAPKAAQASAAANGGNSRSARRFRRRR